MNAGPKPNPAGGRHDQVLSGLPAHLHGRLDLTSGTARSRTYWAGATGPACPRSLLAERGNRPGQWRRKSWKAPRSARTNGVVGRLGCTGPSAHGGAATSKLQRWRQSVLPGGLGRAAGSSVLGGTGRLGSSERWPARYHSPGSVLLAEANGRLLSILRAAELNRRRSAPDSRVGFGTFGRRTWIV